MKADELLTRLAELAPLRQAETLTEALKAVFPHLEEDDRKKMLLRLTEDAGADKVSSLAHL